MATDSTNNQSKASEEIDLKALLQSIGNFFQNAFERALDLIIYFRRLVKKRLVLFVILAAIGAGSGIVINVIKQPHYVTSAVVNSQFFRGKLIQNAFANLNDLAEEGNHLVLAEKLHIDTVSASLIKSFSLEVLMSEADRDLYETLLEGLDPQNNPVLYNQIQEKLSADNQTTYKIVAELYDPEVIPELDSAVLHFLLDNEFIKKRIAINNINLERREEKIAQELDKMDSLSSLIYLNYQRMAQDQNRGSNNVYVGGAEESAILNPLQVYREGLDLYNQELEVKRARFLNEDIEMIENFTRFQKPKVAGKIRLSLMGFLAGIALALGISLALDFNKFLDRVEDSRKQAA